MFQRLLSLPEPGTETFFLWGPRQAGKSTLLRQRYPDGVWVDLLKADEFRRYVARPELLREELEAAGPERSRQVVIDEIQKVPALLDEVHWLNREPRAALRFVRVECAQGEARRGEPARRARRAL